MPCVHKPNSADAKSRAADCSVIPEDHLEKGSEMKAKGIPDVVKQKAEYIIEEFNRKTLRKRNCFYQARFKGKFLYLDRADYGNIGPICRLSYTGNMGKWEFAIFKWSSEKYDPGEWFFPGSQHIDGSIEGAMKAGLDAYPA